MELISIIILLLDAVRYFYTPHQLENRLYKLKKDDYPPLKVKERLTQKIKCATSLRSDIALGKEKGYKVSEIFYYIWGLVPSLR